MRKNILKLTKKDESQKLEFKSSLSAINKIVEEVCAFANAMDGLLVIGISPDKNIKGVQIGKNSIEQLSNKITDNTDPPIYPNISVETVKSKSIIIIEVMASENKPHLAFGRAYKRVGNVTKLMSRDEQERLTLERKKVYFDEQICQDATIDEIDNGKVRWFLEKARHERNFDVDPKISIEEALGRLRLQRNRGFANATILLFGKNPQKYFLQAKTRCARFKGTEPLDFIDMKVLEGNIIDQRNDALGFVMDHIKLHAKIVETERMEKWEYPIEAVREAITNALSHRDYEIASNVQVRIFDDRIEIWGCGPLPEPLTVDDLKKKHESILRNPLIADCLFLIKYIEEWGTGTNRIIRECLEHGLPEPLFEIVSGSLVVTFRKYYVPEEVFKELNDRQKKAIEYIKTHKKITNEDFQSLCPGISRETLRKDLNHLIAKNIIIRKGIKRGAFYILK